MTLQLHDITERLNLALTSANMGVWSWDMQKDIVTWDDGLFRLFGYEAQSFVPTVEKFLNAVHPEDREGARIYLQEVCEQKKHYDYECRTIWPDLSVHTLSARGKIYLDDQGTPLRLIGTCWDVTRRSQAEAYIREQQQQLARVSQISSMVEVASLLAHELNQPLSAIALYCETALALIQKNPQSTVELLFALQKSVEMTKRAGEIIHRIKSCAKQSRITCRDEIIVDVIQEAIGFVKSEFLSHRMNITLVSCPKILKANIDKIQIQQVMINLIRNSIEAVRDRALEVPTIAITGKIKKNKLQLTVEDNGPGFSESTLEKIFDPYFTTKQYGMGIGLSICRTIIELHGGQLSAGNGKQGGAVMNIELPFETESVGE